MYPIARYTAYLAGAALLGLWLTLTFWARLTDMLKPALGEAAVVVVMLLLMIGPALLIAMLQRRLS